MYNRVLLKISGEALSGDSKILDSAKLDVLGEQIQKVYDLGVEICIVVGAGNIVRGKFAQELGLDRVQVDNMGMLGTTINALALQGQLEKRGIPTRVQTAIKMDEVAEPFIVRRAIRHLEKKRIVIFAAGTGQPFFSTDTAAALRAAEVHAEVILMAKNGVDGVYSDDPRINPDAVKFDRLSYMDVITKSLKVMDQTAITICMENHIDLVVFNMNEITNIQKVVEQQPIGTVISKEA